MKTCNHKNCSRRATCSNNDYFPNEWYCTYHANRLTQESRRKRKYGHRKTLKQDEL